MNAQMKHAATIPMNLAVLCLDCNSISDANRQCPACSSHALMNLSTVLDRPAQIPQQRKLAVAA